LKRRLPADFGRAPVLVTPDAALRFWRRDLRAADPALLEAALPRPAYNTLAMPG
jgi:hypothetical protein